MELPKFRLWLVRLMIGVSTTQMTLVGFALYYNQNTPWFNKLLTLVLFCAFSVQLALNYFEPRIRASAAADVLKNQNDPEPVKPRQPRRIPFREQTLKWDLPKQ